MEPQDFERQPLLLAPEGTATEGTRVPHPLPLGLEPELLERGPPGRDPLRCRRAPTRRSREQCGGFSLHSQARIIAEGAQQMMRLTLEELRPGRRIERFEELRVQREDAVSQTGFAAPGELQLHPPFSHPHQSLPVTESCIGLRLYSAVGVDPEALF